MTNEQHNDFQTYDASMKKGNLADAIDALDEISRRSKLNINFENERDILYGMGETVRNVADGEEISIVQVTNNILGDAIKNNPEATRRFIRSVKSGRFTIPPLDDLPGDSPTEDYTEAGRVFLHEIESLPEGSYKTRIDSDKFEAFPEEGDNIEYHKFVLEKYGIEMSLRGGWSLLYHLGIELFIKAGLRKNHFVEDPHEAVFD